MPPIISLEPSLHANSRAMGKAVRNLETRLVRHAAPTLAGIKPANLFTYRTASFAEEETSSAIAEISSRLAGFHLRVEPLANRTQGVLLLVFRPKLVESALNNEHARKLLTQSGFKDLSAEGVVSEIKRRIQAADASRAARVQTNSEAAPEPKPERFIPCCATGKHHDHGPNHVCQCRAKAALSREELETTQGESEFPHEIGLVLGYPPADVAGFIAQKGTGYLACGGWKAYSEPQGVLETFQRNRRCTEEFQALYAQGAPLEALADTQGSVAVSIFDMARAAV